MSSPSNRISKNRDFNGKEEFKSSSVQVKNIQNGYALPDILLMFLDIKLIEEALANREFRFTRIDIERAGRNISLPDLIEKIILIFNRQPELQDCYDFFTLDEIKRITFSVPTFIENIKKRIATNSDTLLPLITDGKNEIVKYLISKNVPFTREAILKLCSSSKNSYEDLLPLMERFDIYFEDYCYPLFKRLHLYKSRYPVLETIENWEDYLTGRSIVELIKGDILRDIDVDAAIYLNQKYGIILFESNQTGTIKYLIGRKFKDWLSKIDREVTPIEDYLHEMVSIVEHFADKNYKCKIFLDTIEDLLKKGDDVDDDETLKEINLEVNEIFSDILQKNLPADLYREKEEELIQKTKNDVESYLRRDGVIKFLLPTAEWYWKIGTDDKDTISMLIELFEKLYRDDH